METHGMSHHSAFRSWEAMIDRCTNPRCKDYPAYGGRGITVCDDWLSPIAFCRYMGEKPRGMSIGRIHNDEGYKPGNVEWQTPMQQGANKRNSRVPGGLAAAARAADMSESALRRRLDAGMSLNEAVKSEVRDYSHRGITEMALAHGVSMKTMRKWLDAGVVA
ncbi:hypothetical protein [Caballeronia sp. ATUFL_M1_KS5A]|uniref:hypothetical protein n=1 Tax=Caballeronia sp. ATUFL_M1_KS5A TaxID=2921778 RepID=UPI002027B9E8|nr:hypothetical protein [Caballeronia sp. ATUFL_M1_KS5A]